VVAAADWISSDGCQSRASGEIDTGRTRWPRDLDWLPPTPGRCHHLVQTFGSGRATGPACESTRWMFPLQATPKTQHWIGKFAPSGVGQCSLRMCNYSQRTFVQRYLRTFAPEPWMRCGAWANFRDLIFACAVCASRKNCCFRPDASVSERTRC
jgi:hypothetical protein